MSCNCYEWQHMNADRSVENLGIIRTMTTTEYSHLTALKPLNAHRFWFFKRNTLTHREQKSCFTHNSVHCQFVLTLWKHLKHVNIKSKSNAHGRNENSIH